MNYGNVFIGSCMTVCGQLWYFTSLGMVKSIEADKVQCDKRYIETEYVNTNLPEKAGKQLCTYIDMEIYFKRSMQVSKPDVWHKQKLYVLARVRAKLLAVLPNFGSRDSGLESHGMKFLPVPHKYLNGCEYM